MNRSKMPDSERPIVLVTGTPRSGTTAVGNMLALGPTTCTLHEPFSFHSGIIGVDRYFLIPGTSGFSEEQLDQYLDGIRRLRLRFRRGIFPQDNAFRRMVKLVIGGRTRLSYYHGRLRGGSLRTVIWKDPFAALLLHHLVRRGIRVLVTIRNPHAMAASLKRMRWAFQLEDIFSRMERVGLEVPPSWERWRAERDDPVINGALLWDAVHRAVLRSAESRLVRLVAISEVVDAPVETYRELYDFAGLPWSESVAQQIRESYTVKGKPDEPQQGKAHDQNRDLRAVNEYWRKLLTEREVDAVSDIAAATWERISSALVRNSVEASPSVPR